MSNKHDQVSIHIDKQEHESPNPTTGAQLYILGNVDAGYDLYQEIPGSVNDPIIPNTDAEIHLKNGEHFYTAQKKLNPGTDGT